MIADADILFMSLMTLVAELCISTQVTKERV